MKERLKKLWQNKTVRIVLICIVALILLLAVWGVFFKNDAKETSGVYQSNELETKLSLILSEIEGVGQTRVMIGETDGAPASAIIVFSGEDGILTRMRLIEVTSNALGIPPSQVLVYPSE